MAVFTGVLLSFLWSFLASSVVWLLLAVVFGIRKNMLVVLLVLTMGIFGAELVFGFTDGLQHIWTVGWLALLNQNFNAFTLGAVLAVTSIVAVIISAIASLVKEASE